VLVAEHAAIFGYGPIGARLDASTVPLALQAEAAHRGRRDALKPSPAGEPPGEPGCATSFPQCRRD